MSKYSNVLKIPVKVKPFLRVDTLGDAVYDTAIDTTCYKEDKVKVVLSREGQEVVSQSTFYIENTFDIGWDDLIYFEDKDYHIKSLSGARRKEGKVALWTVYA